MNLFPIKHTVFDCDDRSISRQINSSVFEHFIFGENIAEQWVYLFSWMAPPGIVSLVNITSSSLSVLPTILSTVYRWMLQIILIELCYSMHIGCVLSHHLKTPLVLRRTFRLIGRWKSENVTIFHL